MRDSTDQYLKVTDPVVGILQAETHYIKRCCR